jgi:superfamily II DNA or RNA helicase
VNVHELVRETKFQPRPYQERIVRKALDLFGTQGVRSVLIDSPTGSGKTLMGMMIGRALHERLGVQVGWVAMRRHLLAQAAREDAAQGIDVPCTWISMFDRNPPTGLDLLVVDEAQHDAAGSMAHLHNVIQPRFILGLSATPFRTDRMNQHRVRPGGFNRAVSGMEGIFHRQ